MIHCRTVLALAAAVALVGCATSSAPPASAGSMAATAPTTTTPALAKAGQVVVKASEALKLADAAYQAAVPIAEGLISAGIISPGEAIMVRDIESRASQALATAHAALSVAEQAQAVAQAVTAINTLTTIAPAATTINH
jgi:hypothetical protein